MVWWTLLFKAEEAAHTTSSRPSSNAIRRSEYTIWFLNVVVQIWKAEPDDFIFTVGNSRYDPPIAGALMQNFSYRTIARPGLKLLHFYQTSLSFFLLPLKDLRLFLRCWTYFAASCTWLGTARFPYTVRNWISIRLKP